MKNVKLYEISPTTGQTNFVGTRIIYLHSVDRLARCFAIDCESFGKHLIIDENYVLQPY